VKNAIERMAIMSSTTATRFLMAPVPRMATCGWLMMGVPKVVPKTP